MNPHAYSITVKEIVFDGDQHFESRVKELPDVREYAATAGEAYDLAVDTIETAAEMFAEERMVLPARTSNPKNARQFPLDFHNRMQ